MNIKKLFSVAAVVTFVGSTFLPGLAQAETPDTELGHAYEWAHSKGITTMDTYEKANMYGAITRAEMAKMLSVYATEILGKTADTSKACEFSDIASVGGDLKDFIVKSCQLSVMGQNITAFRPYDTITRAEFGTALSRVLWGDTYNNGTPYYANHLNALKEAGIMKQIANADSTKEIRGYVMIMLQRASEGEDKDLCEMCLATGIGADKCEAVCGNSEEEKDTTDSEKVKSGDLAVTASESAGRKILATGTSDLDTLKFKTSEEVEITKITLERFGYSSNASVKEVWLENEDGAVITNKASLNSKGQANLTIKKDYRKVDGTFNATVVLDATSKAGETIGFKVIDADSTAKNLNIDNYKPYTYDVVVYSGTEVTFTIRNTEKTYNYEAGESYEVSKFKVKAPSDSSILVKGFTLTNTGNLDVEKHLDKVEVTVAGKTVKASANINKDDELVIGFDEDVEIAAKANVEFIVKMSFAEGFDAYAGTVWYFIAEAADFSAIDSKTESRVDLDSQVTAGKIGAATSWPKYTFNGGKVKLTNTKLGNVDAAQDSTDVVVAEGTIKVPESIKGNLTVNIIGVTNTNGAFSGSAKAITAMRLQVAGDEYEGATPVYGADGTTGSVTFTNVEIEEGGKVRFLVDIVEGSDYENLNVNFEIAGNGWSDFYYVEGKKTDTIDVAGSISFSKLTIQAGKASLKNNLTKKVEFKKGEVSRYPVFEGTYTAKKKDLKLNSYTIEGTGVSANTGIVTFYLIIDGEEVADMKLTGNNVLRSGSDTFTDVEIAAGDSVKVVVEAEVNAKSSTGGNLGSFKLYLNGEDTDGNKAGNASAKTVELRIVDKGSVTIPASTSKKTVLLREANSKLAEFVIKPANGASEVDIDSVSFVLSGDSAFLGADDVTVTFNGTTEDGTYNSTSHVITFEPNLTVDEKGATIVVSIDDEIDGSVILTGLRVNETDFTSRTFSKQYQPAIAYISKQKGGNGTTTFNIGVETTDSSITVSNLKLIIGTGSIKADGTVATTTGEYAIAGDFSDGEEVEAVENGNNVQMITAIEYSWADSSKTGAGSTGTVYVDKNVFGDYFKVGDEYAKIFKAN